MSYTPEDQLLSPSLNAILSGIEKFTEAAGNRIKQEYGGWSDEHIQELNVLRKEMMDWEVRLRKLESETR